MLIKEQKVEIVLITHRIMGILILEKERKNSQQIGVKHLM